MTFEFLTVYRHTPDTDIFDVLRNLLAKVLEDNLNEFDSEAVERMIVPRHKRIGKEAIIFGFTLELPDETAQMQIMVDEFIELLPDTPPIVHVVKFDDPLLQADLVKWAEEIFALEMKLRRVLTLIYLHAYQGDDLYNLLRDEIVQPLAKERPKPEQMKAAAENQFFHLTFGQYVGLNQRPEFKPSALLEVIRDSENYDTLRAELSRAPVKDEDDAVLLAGLKERMDAIEAMRNSVAHNRRPTRRVVENYDTARPLLDELLNDYLERFEWEDPESEMFWERAAREAIEQTLETAMWDDDDKTITLFQAHEPRMRQAVASLEELKDYLREESRRVFYANAPIEDGEFVFECDEDEFVEAALSPYEERLADFFEDADE